MARRCSLLIIVFRVAASKTDEVSCLAGATKFKRLAERPPIIRIPDLLSRDECEELIHLAKTSRDFESSSKATTLGNQAALSWQKVLASREGKAVAFDQYDVDKDDLLQEHEVSMFLTQGWNMPNHNQSRLRRAIAKTLSKADGDARRRRRKAHKDNRPLTRSEFIDFDWLQYDSDLRRKQPHLFARYSDQARLPHQHPAVAKLHARLAHALGVTSDVFMQSEELLVVSYPKRGHYSCHSDNSEEDGAYPHRYLTAEVFLNDDFDGGEVVFPYADSNSDNKSWRARKTECTPTQSCLPSPTLEEQSGAIVVHPKRGDALIFDNVATHNVDSSLEQLLPHSLHAGCEVRRGAKWIAIQWAWSSAVIASGRTPSTTKSRLCSLSLA